MTLKVGDKYQVWWNQSERDENGNPLATILAISPYKGMYPQYFKSILKLTSETKRGWVEMAVEEE